MTIQIRVRTFKINESDKIYYLLKDYPWPQSGANICAKKITKINLYAALSQKICFWNGGNYCPKENNAQLPASPLLHPSDPHDNEWASQIVFKHVHKVVILALSVSTRYTTVQNNHEMNRRYMQQRSSRLFMPRCFWLFIILHQILSVRTRWQFLH